MVTRGLVQLPPVAKKESDDILHAMAHSPYLHPSELRDLAFIQVFIQQTLSPYWYA